MCFLPNDEFFPDRKVPHVDIPILTLPIDATDYAASTRQVVGWARAAESRSICCANVHLLMEAHDSPVVRLALDCADLVTPDGMPLVWMMRLKGIRGQDRVYGPDLMLHVLEAAAKEDIPVGFYGGAPRVLDALVSKMQQRYPGLETRYTFGPPFRELTEAEDQEIGEEIAASGARILFVGLGCPKQELWMAAHRGRIPAVMIGVGAAFDFHAGLKPQAPQWMQRLGLEWAFRFASEPRRLWRRYLYHNPRFILLAIADLLGVLR